MSRSGPKPRPQPGQRSAARKQSSTEIVVLGLLVLVPALFYRGVTDAFEFPKTELLATGALILGAIFLAGEWARLGLDRFPGWFRSTRTRAWAGLRRDPLGAAILLFLASAVLSTVTSIHPEMSVLGAAESHAGLKTAFATAALYFASRSLGSDERWLRRVARAAGAAMAIAVLYALLQLARWDPFEWTRSATLGEFRRVPGTLGHPNHLGAYIAMTLPLLAWLATRATSRAARLLWISLGALSLPVLAATLSRGAWVAFAAGWVAFGLLSWRAAGAAAATPGSRSNSAPVRVTRTWSPRLIAAAVILTLAAATAPLLTPLRPQLLSRVRQITDLRAPSTQSRVHLWRAGIRMAEGHPVLGAGTDAYLAAFPRYRTPNYWRVAWNRSSAKAHNELIQVAATQGIVGLLAALLVLLFAGRAIVQSSRHPNPTIRSGAAAAGGGLVAFATQDLASFTVAATGSLAAVLAGWVAGAARRAHADPARPSESPASWREKPGALAWSASLLLSAALWIPLVMTPWRAETAATPGLLDSTASPAGAVALARASAIAPWDVRYALELGRSLLGQAFFATADSAARWELLDRAGSSFERAVRLAPDDGESRALLGRARAGQAALGQAQEALDRARAEFERALGLEPENPVVLDLVAEGYLEAGRLEDAAGYARRCAQIYPEYALPMADLGIIALMEGRYRDGADTLSLALARDWHDADGAEAAARQNLSAALAALSAPTPTPRRPAR